MPPTYDKYPAVDEGYNFPPVVRQSIANSVEIGDRVEQKLDDKIQAGEFEGFSGVIPDPDDPGVYIQVGDAEYLDHVINSPQLNNTYGAAAVAASAEVKTAIDERELIAVLKSLNTLARGGRVALLGDSITAGPISGTPFAFYANARSRLWHDWWFFLAFQRVHSVGNYAVGAKNIQHVRDVQIPMMFRNIDQWPDAAILAMGTNNLADTTEVAWGYFLQVVATLAHRGVRPILTLIPPNTTNPAKVTAWNAKVTEFAAATGLPLIDRYTPVATGPGAWISGLSDDGTHPNDAGHRTTGHAVAADAALAAAFLDSYPDIDLTTGITGASTDTYNLAGGLWNNFNTPWDVSAWADDTSKRYWLDTAFSGFLGGKTVEAATFNVSSGGARNAYFTITATTDIELSMLARIRLGAFASVYVQAQDASDANLGRDVPLALALAASSANRDGLFFGRIKAPRGTAKFKVRIETFGNNTFGAITARSAARLG